MQISSFVRCIGIKRRTRSFGKDFVRRGRRGTQSPSDAVCSSRDKFKFHSKLVLFTRKIWSRYGVREPPSAISRDSFYTQWKDNRPSLYGSVDIKLSLELRSDVKDPRCIYYFRLSDWKDVTGPTRKFRSLIPRGTAGSLSGIYRTRWDWTFLLQSPTSALLPFTLHCRL